MLSLTDVTDLDHQVLATKRTLRESEERYGSLFKSTWDAMMTIEPPSWRFSSANPSMLRMFKAKDEAEFALYRPWTLSPERQPDGRISEEKAKEMIATAMRDGCHSFEWTAESSPDGF